MLDREGFNDWAANYDAAVNRSKGEKTYPFCGYDEVHERVFSLVSGARHICDLGVGTARLTSRLYGLGKKITAVDFSENMLAAAKAKMPGCFAVLADLTEGLPKELIGADIDACIMLYAIHHLNDAQKAALITDCFQKTDCRMFVIGDVSFGTEEDRLACKRVSPGWDDDEFYTVFDALKKKLGYPSRFERISFCAGVTVIEKT